MEGYLIKEGQTDVVWINHEPYNLVKLNTASEDVLAKFRNTGGHNYSIIELSDGPYILRKIER